MNSNEGGSDPRVTVQPISPTALPTSSIGQPATRSTAPRRASDDSSSAVSSLDYSNAIGLIEAVAPFKQREQAVIAMVRFIARVLPDATVRCGIGTIRLHRLFDSRLGWLSNTSDLFEKTADQWEDDAASLPTRPAVPRIMNADRTSRAHARLRLNIDDDSSVGRCVLWIQGGTLGADDRAWLRKSLPTLRVLIWHRSGGVLGTLRRLLWGRDAMARIYAGLILLFLVLLSLWPVSYRVRCSTQVRPKHSRVVSAPFAATLQATHVQPGDAVKMGDPLVTLDGRPIRLELESIEAQIARVSKEKDIAMVGGQVADAQQAILKIRELSRSRDLLRSRLARLEIRSPIDGIVVLGDLSRSIGAPLETGQAVIEIASLDTMVIELEVPDYEIGYVESGTAARIRMAAAEGHVFDQVIDDVFPSAELREGQNVFIATINVDNQQSMLRPGMRGQAIAYGPVRPWLWSFARKGWENLIWWLGF